MSTQMQGKQPDFASLSEIMKRFEQVPYIQFREELNNWFSLNYPNHTIKGDPKFLNQLRELTNDIFKNAEILTERRKNK